MNTLKSESLLKATHSAAFVVSDLRTALSKATPVEALVLLPLIEQAAHLQQRIEALRAAVEEQGA
jgi:hypothetical protein